MDISYEYDVQFLVVHLRELGVSDKDIKEADSLIHHAGIRHWSPVDPRASTVAGNRICWGAAVRLGLIEGDENQWPKYGPVSVDNARMLLYGKFGSARILSEEEQEACRLGFGRHFFFRFKAVEEAFKRSKHGQLMLHMLLRDVWYYRDGSETRWPASDVIRTLQGR